MKPSKAGAGFKVNVNKENKGGSKPVAAGLYSARAACKAKTSNSGKDMLAVEWTLEGKDPNGQNVAGRKVFDNVTFEESMVWKWNNLYKAGTGEEIPEADFTFEEMFGLVANAIQGKKFTLELTVVPKKDGDGENNSVKKVLA